MPGDAATKRATYADVLAAPEHMVAEVLFGVLYTHPRPANPHARTTTQLTAELAGPFDRGRGGPGGWIILDEPELHLRDDIVVPDLAAWRRERLPRIPNAPYFELAPDWACEVLSPATTKIDRTDKLAIYAREKVRFVWLIDPLAHTLEVLRLGQNRYEIFSTHKDDDVVRAEPFDAVPLELSVLWADVAPG
ncbi:MAG TPA: Uma2 family endonuclease [Polyangiaceae bacterium]|jgi:Uma2 family endonuclease